MSSGRKKSKNKIKAPPQITRTEYNLPTGDSYRSETQGGTERFSASLSGTTRNLVGQSQTALKTLAKEIRKPGDQRAKDIRNRADDFFGLQSESINKSADDLLKKTQTGLNKRFKGSYNATFGTDLLSKVEDDRLNRLMRSRKESNLLAEDLYQNDEDRRIRRFSLFQNYLNDINNQARGFATQGSNVLSSERNRATRVATAQAQLDQAADFKAADLRNAAEARRFNAIQGIVTPGLQSAFSKFLNPGTK